MEPQEMHLLPIFANNIFQDPWSTGVQLDSSMEGQEETSFALFLFALGSL